MGDGKVQLWDGKVLVSDEGKVAVADECCCAESINDDCESTPASGCDQCSCCNAEKYRICIVGGTGDCTVVNNAGGWIVSKTTGCGYEHILAETVKIAMSLGGLQDRTATVSGYKWFGGAWVACFSGVGVNLGPGTCSGDTTSGVYTIKVRPTRVWAKESITVEFSGITVCTVCQWTGGSWKWTSPPSVGPNASFVLDRGSGTSCLWTYVGTCEGTIGFWDYPNDDCSDSPDRTLNVNRVKVTVDMGDVNPAAVFLRYYKSGDESDDAKMFYAEGVSWDCWTDETGIANSITACLAPEVPNAPLDGGYGGTADITT